MSDLSQLPSKRRPSIELAPSLERPVFIITKNLNAPHIASLTQELDKHKIAYQMQQQTTTLGCDLKQRFFVIVDNQKGEVTLGPQFGSILMSIVGYPRIGRNLKNKYFTRPSQIIAFYQKFKNDRDISQKQKTLIRSQYMDVIIENEGSTSKLSNKIVARSICKYKSPEKEEKSSEKWINDSLLKQQQKVKLLIMEDKSEVLYSKLCCDILQRMSPKCLVQTIESLYQFKKRTLYQTNKYSIYYLTNLKHEKQLLENMTVGQAIVFVNKHEVNVFRKIINEEKIYAMCCEQNEVIRILEKVGFLFKMPSQLPETSKIQEPSLIVNEVKKSSHELEPSKIQKSEKGSQIKKELDVQEVSKIEGVQSVFSKNGDESDINVSVVSSVSQSKKIKRLKLAKQKPKQPQNKGDSQLNQEYYLSSKKENEVPPDHKGVLRKKTLKNEDKEISKSKKSLKFIDEMVSPHPKLRKIKSIQKCGPQTIEMAAEESCTMTENEYFLSTPISKLSANRNSRDNSSENPSTQSKERVVPQIQNEIHAIFYHEFIPKFHNIVHLIKLSPKGLFAQRTTLEYYQPFFNLKEFDRAARKIKQKLRSQQKGIQVFNFLVLILQEEVEEFQKYLERKNLSYEEELIDIDGIYKATNSSFLGSKGFKINIFMFIEGEKAVIDESTDFGKIKLVKRGIGQCLEGVSESDVTTILGQKIQEEQTSFRRWVEQSGSDLIHS